MSQIQTEKIKDSFIALGDALMTLSGRSVKLKSATDALSKAISESLSKNVTANIIHTAKKENFFGMSVTPDKSTIEKISYAVVNAEGTVDVIKDLWKKSSSWRLDIDDTLFQFLSAEELTAVTLHEIGHIVDTDSVPNRLHGIVQFGLATNPVAQRAMMISKPVFSKFMAIPVSSACGMNYDRASIRKEIKADNMAVSNGYKDALVSGMSKIENYLNKFKLDLASDSELKASVEYTNARLQQISDRKAAIAKNDLNKFRRFLESSDEEFFGKSVFCEAVEECCECFDQNYLGGNTYFEELALISKKLEPIDRNKLDYIRLKIESMETNTDKMAIVSYINSKLELAEYYVSILHDKKASKKYKVPHTEEYLNYVIDTLNALKEKAFAKKIGNYNYYGIHVDYPEGYQQ